jgi:hypothetical protein
MCTALLPVAILLLAGLKWPNAAVAATDVRVDFVANATAAQRLSALRLLLQGVAATVPANALSAGHRSAALIVSSIDSRASPPPEVQLSERRPPATQRYLDALVGAFETSPGDGDNVVLSDGLLALARLEMQAGELNSAFDLLTFALDAWSLNSEAVVVLVHVLLRLRRDSAALQLTRAFLACLAAPAASKCTYTAALANVGG